MYRRLIVLLGLATSAYSATIGLPGGTYTVPSLFAGATFAYSGTLTDADTIGFAAGGNPCLQSGPGYCTNAAGVVVMDGVGGGQTVGSTLLFGSYPFGSLLMAISGVGTVQVFPANAANGLGSMAPPLSLVLPDTSLSALGFGSFSVSNPDISFTIQDSLFGDNSGSMTLTQAQASVPEPGVGLMMASALAGLAMLLKRRRS